ncbi:hypothetical protein RI065_10035 [Mycoplasmatota bacterium zrk1]
MFLIIFDKRQNNKFIKITDLGKNSSVKDGGFDNLRERLPILIENQNYDFVRIFEEDAFYEKIEEYQSLLKSL